MGAEAECGRGATLNLKLGPAYSVAPGFHSDPGLQTALQMAKLKALPLCREPHQRWLPCVLQ